MTVMISSDFCCSFPVGSFEENRLNVLSGLGILDTPADIEFDRITSLASTVFSTPIALVSLVDSTRQWFKSNHGLGDVRETKRELAFCGHAIMVRRTLFRPYFFNGWAPSPARDDTGRQFKSRRDLEPAVARRRPPSPAAARRRSCSPRRSAARSRTLRT